MLRRIVSIVALFCLCPAVSLLAESLPDYVVSASRESEEVLDAPAQVTVITAEQIEASGKKTLVSVLEDAADVTFRSYSTEAQAQVSMRGFGSNSFGRVQVLVDGRKLNNADMNGLDWQAISLSSIDRIEILDGPSSVLYGSGAVGGVINIITKESAAGVTADATLTYGSFNTKKAQLSGGYGTDQAGFLVSADIDRADGFRDRTQTADTNVALNGFVDVTNKLTVKPSFSYANVYYQMPGALTKAAFEADPGKAADYGNDGVERDIDGAILARLAENDNLAFELPLSYNHQDRKADWASSAYTTTTQHQFEAKPKVTYGKDTFAGFFRLVGGVDFEGTILNVADYSDSSRTNKAYDFDITQFSGAPYISGTLKLPAGFEAGTGARFSLTSIHAVNDAGGIDSKDMYRNFAYDVTLNYRPAEIWSAYTRFNTMFRIPFVDEKAELYGSSGDQFNANLVPETGYNIELGGKFRAGKKVSASANVYFMMMKDEIDYGPSWHNVNLDPTRRIGGNVDLSVEPFSFVELSANAGYVNAVFADGSNKGKAIPLVSSLTANSTLVFKIPMGIRFGTDVSYTGECYTAGDYGNVSDKMSAYTLVGLFVRITPPQLDGKLSLGARIDNFLDKSYATYASYSSYDGTTSWYPASGRSVTVSASYKY